MARLLVAVCRAAGVPARYLGGFVTESSAVLSPEAYHNWAEVYDGTAWRVADPQGQVWMSSPSRFIATRIEDTTVEPPLGDHERFRSETSGLNLRMLPAR